MLKKPKNKFYPFLSVVEQGKNVAETKTQRSQRKACRILSNSIILSHLLDFKQFKAEKDDKISAEAIKENRIKKN